PFSTAKHTAALDAKWGSRSKSTSNTTLTSTSTRFTGTSRLGTSDNLFDSPCCRRVSVSREETGEWAATPTALAWQRRKQDTFQPSARQMCRAVSHNVLRVR